jgi:capsule polysaccharide export protein KpsE/RkpR
MELDAFIRQVVRRWYIIVVLVAAAIGGTLVYHLVTGEQKATSVMAVLQPKVAAPGEYIPPVITLEAVDESSELAERVAPRLNDGTTASEIKDKMSVDIRVTTKPSLTPLYTVNFSDPDKDRALAVNAIVVEEAIKLYGELHQPDAKDVRAAFKPELDRAEGDANAAQAALTQFEQTNDAANLPARRDQIRGYIQQLQLIELQLQSGQVTSSDLSGGPLLTAARAELDRLSGLEGDYTKLKWDVDTATMDVARLQTRVSDLTIAQPGDSGVSPLLAQAQQELNAGRARLEQAQDALTSFQTQNNVANATASREAQLAIVNQLTLAATSQRTGASTIAAELGQQRAELQRLESLEPQYNDLALELQRAEVQLSTLQQRVLDVISGQTLPAEAQVRVLGQPEIESNLFWMIITYGLAVLLAVFGAFTIIYLLAVFEPMRPTVPALESYFEMPVLAHVPHASTRKED